MFSRLTMQLVLAVTALCVVIPGTRYPHTNESVLTRTCAVEPRPRAEAKATPLQCFATLDPVFETSASPHGQHYFKKNSLA
jgi:hypothetical protein